MADSYVCSGAIMRCTMGTSQAKLTVLPIRTVYLTGQPMANISDHVSFVNLAPFGRCRSMGFPATASATAAHHGHLTPMPCMHNTPFPWMDGKNDYIIKGDPALLKSSTCACIWGGTISLVTDGQNDTGPADMSKKDTEDFESEQQAEEGLDVDSILDGIQTALDIAGLLPGVGAIPDLTNVAISAFRGDWVGAGISLVAAIPGIGDAATATKLVRNGVKSAAKNAAKDAAKSVAKGVAKDVGKNAAKDVGKNAAKDAGKGAAKDVGKNAAKDAGKGAAKDTGKNTTKTVNKNAANNSPQPAKGKDVKTTDASNKKFLEATQHNKTSRTVNPNDNFDFSKTGNNGSNPFKNDRITADDNYQVDYGKPNVFENTSKPTVDNFTVDNNKPNIFENAGKATEGSKKIDGNSPKALEDTVKQMEKDSKSYPLGHNLDIKG